MTNDNNDPTHVGFQEWPKSDGKDALSNPQNVVGKEELDKLRKIANSWGEQKPVPIDEEWEAAKEKEKKDYLKKLEEEEKKKAELGDKYVEEDPWKDNMCSNP